MAQGRVTSDETACSSNSDTCHVVDEKVVLTVTDVNAAKELFWRFDEFRRFQVQTAFESFSKVSDLIERGTTLYEKLIFLNGTVIALSITFLASLSSHLAAIHLNGHPPLWMVSCSWILLLISIYCSYRCIIDRHSATYALYAPVASTVSDYVHQALAVYTSRLSRLIKGELSIEGKSVELSELFSGCTALLNEARRKKSDEIASVAEEMKKESFERPAAHAAIWCSMTGIALLCVFTVRTVSLLF